MLEAEDEDGSNIATVTVHDPVSEIVSVYHEMVERRVREPSRRAGACWVARGVPSASESHATRMPDADTQERKRDRDPINAARSAMYATPSANTMSVLRREHALCFMHRATLRSAGLHFTQVFNGNLLNKQLPIDLPHKALVKLLALFRW